MPATPTLKRRTVLAGLAALAAPTVRAEASTPVKFSCDFRLYGGTAPFFYGLDQGLFKAQGIDATVDGSLGSADAVTRVASGGYDFGCADVSTLVEFSARNPGIAPKLVMPIYDRYPACIVSLGSKPVIDIKGLEGIRLGIASADAGSRILPALLRLKGVDPGKIDMITIDQRLRDTMLIQRRVDAVIGFDYTSMFNLIGNGIPRQDIHLVYFSDNGFNFYGQGLIAARKHIDGNPALVRGMATAVAQSWLASWKSPEAAIASVTKRDALADSKVETERLNWVLNHHVITPNVRANGIGAMDVARLVDGIKIVSEGFQLGQPVPADQVFDGRFIPPMDVRRVG